MLLLWQVRRTQLSEGYLWVLMRAAYGNGKVFLSLMITKGSRPLARDYRLDVQFLQPQVTQQIVCYAKQWFTHVPQRMTSSQVFWHGLVYGMAIAIIIILLLIETRRQEQRAKKRGPEENDDYSSWEGNFEVKAIQLCSFCRKIAHISNFRDRDYYP